MPAVDPPLRRRVAWRRRVGITGAVTAAAVGFALTPSWGAQPAAPHMLTAPHAARAVAPASTSGSTNPNIVQAGTVRPAGGSSVRMSQGSDHRAPVLTKLVYTRSVYPLHDGFRDTFWAAVTTNERTVATLVVTDTHHRRVRTVTVTHGPGRFSLVWNGRTGSGHIPPRGTYRWYLAWRDGAGNSAYSATRSLALSHRHLVTRTARATLAGDAFWRAGGSDPSCGHAGRSHYRHGVLLSNACSSSIAAAFYRPGLPRAISYSRIAVQVAGNTSRSGTRIFRAFGARGGSSSFVQGAFVTLPNSTRRVWAFGSVPATGLVSRDRHIVLALSVDNRPGGTRDLDIGQVRTIVSYRVLN